MAELNDKLITYGNLSTFYNNLKSHDLADKADASDVYTKQEADALLDAKQDELTAGQNIDITNDTISADGYVFNDEDGSTALKYKQDAGDGGQVVSNKAIGLGANAEGYLTIAWGDYGAHAEGSGWLSDVKDVTFTWTADSNTITASSDSHDLKVGYIVFYNDVYAKVTAVSGTSITLSNTLGEAQTSVSIKYALGIATGSASHAEGSGNLAIGSDSHAEGFETVSSGGYGSHSEGYWAKAYGQCSHAEGYNTEASGNLSHAEGYGSKAANYQTHAEGCNTLASGFRSHAEGEFTVASGRISHAEGCQNLAQNAFEHSSGVCNKSHSVSADWTSFGSADNTLFSIGDKYPEPKSEYSPADGNGNNAVEIMQNADMYVKGIGGYDGEHIKSETGYESTQTLQDVISGINTSVSGKQDALTAGSNITISNNVISATDTTYSDATTSASGLMSAADKTKLNGIEANAEVNVIEGVILSDSVSPLTPDANKNVTIPLVSTSNDGLMSAEDKEKLNGLEAYETATTQEIQALFVMPAFYVDNTQFITNGKMTWGQWLNSKYNTSSFTHIYTASSYDSTTEQIPEVSSSSYPVAGEYYYSTCQDTSQEGPADNEIWYTTESGELWEPYDMYGGGNTLVIDGNTLLSNTYQDGHGVLRYANDITSLDDYWGNADYDHTTDITSITLPHSITYIGNILPNGNSGLNTVYYNGTVAECSNIDMYYFAIYADFDINYEINCLDGTYNILGEEAEE